MVYTINMRRLATYLLRALFPVLLLSQGVAVLAGEDHDEARRLLKSGDIMSLEQILERLRPDYPGKVIEIELDHDSGKRVYEIEMLGSDGIVRELIIDATTGTLLRTERED
ncbi:MAG TPA: peptidase M4 [Gammaproteobacteria bacterium]|nr:peptidase M4 [Gammaproteobacteria bacterium]